MAQYQIMYWKKIPAQVRVLDPAGDRSATLPPRFQEAIDDVAMRLGLLGSDDYLEGWHWGEIEEAPGAAEEVLRRVMETIDARFPLQRDELLRLCLDLMDT